MSTLTYAGLLNKTITLYQEQGSLEAYQFVTKHADEVGGNKAQIYNFKYALASASGLEKEALQIMEEAIVENGFWYEYEYLMSDEDLQPLHKYEQFQTLVKLCQEREKQVKKDAKAELKIIDEVKEVERKSVVVALHGDQENNKLAEQKWKSITSDYVLALPQSSEPQLSDGYVWEDVEKGTEELKEHLNTIHKQMQVGEIILGGFSAGCNVVLHGMLTNKVTANGIIFVAPWLPNVQEWEEKINQLEEKSLYIICGDKDEDCLESTTQFVELLKKNNIPYTYKRIKGLDHDYPERFDQILKEALLSSS